MPPCHGTDTGCNITRRASGQTSLRCGLTRELDEPIKGAMQMTAELSAGAVSHTSTDWHSIPMEDSQRDCASASSTYRSGNEGRQVAQGASLATPAYPLVQRQIPCRETSDRKPREEHSRDRQSDMEGP